jgi:hypothetical protein
MADEVVRPLQRDGGGRDLGAGPVRLVRKRVCGRQDAPDPAPWRRPTTTPREPPKVGRTHPAGERLLGGEDVTLFASHVDRVAKQRIFRGAVGGLAPPSSPLRRPRFARKVQIDRLGNHDRER